MAAEEAAAHADEDSLAMATIDEQLKHLNLSRPNGTVLTEEHFPHITCSVGSVAMGGS
jgi:hypothetical protein